MDVVTSAVSSYLIAIARSVKIDIVVVSSHPNRPVLRIPSKINIISVSEDPNRTAWHSTVAGNVDRATTAVYYCASVCPGQVHSCSRARSGDRRICAVLYVDDFMRVWVSRKSCRFDGGRGPSTSGSCDQTEFLERAPDRFALGTPSSAGVVDARHGPLDRRAG